MKRFLAVLLTLILTASMAGCATEKRPVKIGVSFGVGAAARWAMEKTYMEHKAQALGAEIEARLNTDEEQKPQKQDCIELIDSGIDVLILIPRDATKVSDILEYAKSKGVPVITYARVIPNEKLSLFVGYDSFRIGQTMGEYLAELVFEGDYIVLSGAPTDNNAALIYQGAMEKINALGDRINILLDASVENWSPEVAKDLVLEAVAANGNKVDAILAPNDKIAGACAEALKELGVTSPVVITGMDAELDALHRVVAGTQSMTVYMDLKELAETAITEAYNMATGAQVNVNAEFDNGSGEGGINANLITGKLVIKENLDRILIDTGHFTRQEIYGN